jgi:hypothetical protein
MPPLNKDFTNVGYWQYDAESNRSFDSLLEQPLKPITRRPRKVAWINEHLNQVKTTINRDDLTKEEIQAAWYSGTEYSRFRRDIGTTVYLINNDPDQVDGVHYTCRGSECRMEESVERRHRWRFQAWSAVLDEQDVERQRGENDVDWVAAVYSQSARTALRVALQLASQDEQDATAYQNELSLKEDFNDDWISSISSHSSCFERYQEASFFDDSGFDDSWIRGISAAA